MAKPRGYPAKVDNSVQSAYEDAFNEKVDYFEDHPKYPVFRKNADIALNLHTGFGLDTITAIDFINRIIVQPATEIEK